MRGRAAALTALVLASGAGCDSGGPSMIEELVERAPYTEAPYRGPGTWVDVFDFSPRFAPDGEPDVTPDDVEAMAAAGVETIYLQAGRDDETIPAGIVEPELLAAFLTEAHDRGMAVVAWYLPEEYDADDLLRVAALEAFEAEGHFFDGIALDIEWRAGVPDLGRRNEALVEFSRALRAQLPGDVLGAVVLPPVLLEVVNPDFWPAFPWRGIARSYDVWLPMTYWTDRRDSSPHRDAFRYTDESVRRLRANLGREDAVVHPIGGIGDETTTRDVEGYLRAAGEVRAVGVSLYDWDTTAPHHWPVLAGGR